MKRTPDDARVLERMRPGVLSGEGFLGTDPRPLADILAADQRTVERLGTTHAAIADRLGAVLEAARAGLGREVEIGPLRAAFTDAMGRIPSPWPGEGVFPKGEVTVTDTRTGRTVRYTPLSLHLVRAHGFYEGRGSRYRLEPDLVARMLDVE